MVADRFCRRWFSHPNIFQDASEELELLHPPFLLKRMVNIMNIHPTCIQHTSNMHPTCIQHASNIHPTCIQHASNMHPTSIQHASNIHPTCIQHASNMHPTCIQHASNTHPTCSQHPSNIHPTYIQHPSNMHPTCIQHASNMHPTCIQHTSNMHPTCIQHTYIMHPSIYDPGLAVYIVSPDQFCFRIGWIWSVKLQKSYPNRFGPWVRSRPVIGLTFESKCTYEKTYQHWWTDNTYCNRNDETWIYLLLGPSRLDLIW